MTDAYGFVFREVLQPAWEHRVRHRPTLDHLAFLHYSEWWSLAELRVLQMAELSALLWHAHRNVPWYREKLRERSIEPRDIRSLDDLSELPLLTRKEAAEFERERESRAEPFPVIRKMTSGTSGRPLAFSYDEGSEHWRNAVKWRGYGWAHYRPGDPSLHFWGDLSVLHDTPLMQRAKVALDHAIKREHFVDCTDRSEAALARVAKQLGELRPKVLVCYAQAGAALARWLVETNTPVHEMSIICAAERLFPADRAVMVRAFGPNVFETYGNREVMLIGAECDAHEGMHLSMENLIVELLVRENDRARPAMLGETGEVVITDLHNFGSPFIRYLTGDLATRLPPGRCSCGRALDRLASVEGRANDTLHDGQGNPVSGMFFNVMFSVMAHHVRQFQVVQKKDGSLGIALVPGVEFGEGVLSLIRENCDKFLPGVPVEVSIVPEIAPDASGKLRVVKVETS